MSNLKKVLITTAAVATAALCSLTAFATVHIFWVDTYQDGVVVSSVGAAAGSIQGEQISKTVGNMTTNYTHTTAATASTQVMIMILWYRPRGSRVLCRRRHLFPLRLVWLLSCHRSVSR